MMSWIRLSVLHRCSFIFALVIGFSLTAGAQGPLLPAGAPAPTMKTLDQVEPRTPISSLPISINLPGSYYLTANLTGAAGANGITINAGDVTIDLNGHSLVGVPGSLSGINIPTAIENIEIRNGTVRAWGHYGINAVLADNCRFLNVQAVANGFGTPFTYGLQAGPRSMIRGCTASGNGSFGIAGGTASIIEGCISTTNGVTGIRAFNCTVTDCSASDNLGPGIHADASTVTDCTVQGNAGGGIRVSDNSTLNGNRCVENGGSFGIRATSSGSRIENNHVLDQAIGLDVDAGGNYVADNIVLGNADNYDIDPGNQLNLLLADIPESIDWPASVKLAGTLTGIAGTNGITINASDVTIDLDGHALVGVPGSLTGIEAPASQRNIEIRNGILREWGSSGVDVSPADNCVLLNLKAYTNGWGAAGSRNGLYGGNNSRIEGCLSEGNRREGIFVRQNSTVDHCSSRNNGNSGIIAGTNSVVRGCTAEINGNAGIILLSDGVIADCSARKNEFRGISAGDACLVRDCTATDGEDSGIVTGDRCTVKSCTSEGNMEHGISVGSGATVSACASSTNGFSGVDTGDSCTVNSCTSKGNGVHGFSVGFGVTVNACTGSYNGFNGIDAGNRSSVRQCVTSNNGDDGISVPSRCSLEGNTANQNGRDGISVTAQCVVKGNTCIDNGSGLVGNAGIKVTTGGGAGDCHIEGNTFIDNPAGLRVTASGNLILRNSAALNSTNYDIAANNKVGVIVFAPNSPAISGSTGGAGVGTTDPWANFSF